jgi:DNA topoisomerase-3
VTEGQAFSSVSAKLSEHFTSPPKAYTEDTLLSAMETAGNQEFDEDTEKKGLGTPATRAAILEKLVGSGLWSAKASSSFPQRMGSIWQ